MRRFDICFLLFLIAGTTARKNFPVLNKVWNLRIGKETDTTAMLWWDFVKPGNVSLPRIEFLVQIESEGKPTRKLRPTFSRKPFEVQLRGLLPAHKYTVKVSATSANWKDSPVTEISFVSLERDWPTPEITGVTSTPRKDFMEYRIKWKIEPLMYWMTHFKIEVCVWSCFELRKERDEYHISVPITYETAFSFKVIAVYKVPDLDEFRRFSKTYSGLTEKSSLGKILGKLSAKQEGRTIKLAWLPSFGPEGPLSYYEFFVCDPSLASKTSKPARTTGSTHLRDRDLGAQRTPLLNGLVYRMKLQNEREHGSSLVPSDFECNQCTAGKPPLFVLVKQTRNAVRFRIFFRNRCDGLYHNAADPDLNSEHIRLGPEVADAFGLSYHSRLLISIRGCLKYPSETVDLCGNFSDFQVLSNAGEPSGVQNLRWELEDTNDDVEVRWEEPANPRGPIKGYKLRVQQMENEKPLGTGNEHWLKADARSFIFHKYDPRITYRVGVAAYNLHVEDDTVVLEGEWKYIIIEAARHWLLWDLVWVYLGHAVVIFIFCTLLHFMVHKEPGRERDIELDHFNVDEGGDGVDEWPSGPVRARNLPDVVDVRLEPGADHRDSDDESHHAERCPNQPGGSNVELQVDRDQNSPGGSGEEPEADVSFQSDQSSTVSEEMEFLRYRLRQLLRYDINSDDDGESSGELGSEDLNPRDVGPDENGGSPDNGTENS